MPNNKKIEKVNELKQKLADSKSVVFAQYHGLSVNDINDLRSKIKEVGGEMSVAKNTLIKIALEEQKMGDKNLAEDLKGPIATFFSYEDAVAPLKVLSEFADEFELPKIVAGLVDGTYANAEKIDILSKLPSKEELLAKLVGSLKSPLSGITNVLGGSQRKLVYALSALAEKRAQE